MRLLTLFIIALFHINFSAFASENTPEAAKSYLNSISDSAFDFLQSDSKSLSERAKDLKKLILNEVNMDDVAPFLLGRYQRKATPAQLQEFSDLVVDYMVLSYVKQLSQYSAKQFEITQAIGQDDSFIVTTLITPSTNDSPFKIQWLVKRNDAGQFKIIDILVGGLSMVVTQRDEFVSVIKRKKGNIDKFLVLLKKKVKSNAKKLK